MTDAVEKMVKEEVLEDKDWKTASILDGIGRLDKRMEKIGDDVTEMKKKQDSDMREVKAKQDETKAAVWNNHEEIGLVKQDMDNIKTEFGTLKNEHHKNHNGKNITSGFSKRIKGIIGLSILTLATLISVATGHYEIVLTFIKSFFI